MISSTIYKAFFFCVNCRQSLADYHRQRHDTWKLNVSTHLSEYLTGLQNTTVSELDCTACYFLRQLNINTHSLSAVSPNCTVGCEYLLVVYSATDTVTAQSKIQPAVQQLLTTQSQADGFFNWTRPFSVIALIWERRGHKNQSICSILSTRYNYLCWTVGEKLFTSSFSV